jgi:hypothetical protein
MNITRQLTLYTSLLGVCRSPGDSSEAGEEPLRKGVDRVGCRLRDNLAEARGDVEAEEVFSVTRSGASPTSRRQRSLAMPLSGNGALSRQIPSSFHRDSI